jgi:hypothetical protein
MFCIIIKQAAKLKRWRDEEKSYKRREKVDRIQLSENL